MRSLHLSVCVLNFCAPSPRIWIEFGLRIWIPTFGFPKHVECMCWVGICKSMFLCFYVFLSCHYDFLSGNLPVPKIIIIGFFGLWGLWFYDFTIFFYVNGQALREHSKLLKNVETMHRRFGVDGGVWFSQNCAKGWKLLAKCYRERQYFSLLDFNASSTNVVPYHQRGISRDRPSFSDMPSC